ncbi:hypothetical protein Godav_021960 [Gossypium davidsonii]|uniref:Uncharacterized protein n=1 Tax=Gossypium davidsonii TaxID=34287 RepID=A0A7J8TFB3_GOSDV|nr:hypothetical protein [Gossypium davidsonii]
MSCKFYVKSVRNRRSRSPMLFVPYHCMTDCMSLKVGSNVNVYVGESQKRLVIPVSFLNHPSFQDLLGKSEEEFGYSHPTGGLTIPCNEDTFLEVSSRMY